jgi:hypothetical protein
VNVRNPWAILVIAVLVSSCGSDSGHLGWSPGPLSIPVDLSLMPRPLRINGLEGLPGAPYTVLSGVVYESTRAGNRPLPGAEVRAQSMSGQVSASATNSEGRYEIRVVYPFNGSPGGLVALQAVRLGYRMPCRPAIAHIAWADGQPHQADIYLVADRTLVTSGIPAAMPRPPSSLSGTVSEQSPDGTRPVVGARVSASPTFTETVSDAQGRYMLCGFAEPYGGWLSESFEVDGELEFRAKVGEIRLTAVRWSHLDHNATVNVQSATSHDLQLVPR